MSLKEIVEVILLIGGFALTIGGALASVVSGTTTVRRAKLTGDLMEQTVTNLQKSFDSLQNRHDAYVKTTDQKITALENDALAGRRESDRLKEVVESMKEQKIQDDAAIKALVALAKSKGASDAQVRLALAGILVTSDELTADPELERTINVLASKLPPDPKIISEKT